MRRVDGVVAGSAASSVSGATVYHPGTTPYGNWWEWQIGSPRHLTDIAAALYEHLGADRTAAVCAAVDHFVPDALFDSYTGTSTGANRVDLCRSVALRGVLGRAPDRIARARERPLPRSSRTSPRATASTPTDRSCSTPTCRTPAPTDRS
ncbi:hypothetical protein SFUMM280S_03424 [Streptomyces fumanus]